MQLDELHYQERPVALLTQITSNIHRDTKKNRKGTPLSEFFMYRRQEVSNLPSGRYGAAMLALIRGGQLPSWALFCYREVTAHAADVAPSLLAFVHPDAMLLAPVSKDGEVEGLLIAKEAASEKVLEMRSPCGQTITVKMPYVGTKIIAEEDVSLRILR